MKKMFKEHDLVKIVSLMLLFVIVLTWIIPTGNFGSGATFTEGEMGRIGLVHIFYGSTFAIQNYGMQIGFLVIVGVFYGVLSHTEAYKALVSRITKFGKGKEIPVALGISLVTALLASTLNNTMVLIAFMPFFVTVLRRIGLSKMSAFAATFGSILVGVLGATIGTDGLTGLVEYLAYSGSELTVTTEILVRIGVFALAFVLYSFFLVVAIRKDNSTKKKEELTDDLFYVEEPKKKKTKVWPIVLILAILGIFAILGFISWYGVFELEIFQTFHEKLMELSIGEFAIFQNLLGNVLPNLNAQVTTEFGSWYLFSYSALIVVITVLVAIASKMKFNDFLSNAWEGIKKVGKPIAFLVFAYMVFVFLYWSPIMPTVINELSKLTSSFNPFVATIQAFLAGFFNSDLAYVGFSLTYYLSNFAGTEGNIIYIIFTSIYGLVQFITPISVFLLFGLSYMDIPYKKWMGYIWKFFLGMLVCLLVIFALLTYI